MFLINGIAQNVLPANDRAVQFGDGCFTTARIKNGRIEFLAAHIERLVRNCTALLIPFSEWALLSQEMQTFSQQYSNGILKVIITRGSSERGYSPSACQTPRRLLTVYPFPTTHYQRLQKKGARLTQSPVKLGRNPYLAGLKHLNCLEQVLIRAYLEQTDADEALVLDSDGWVTECCAANLFWRVGDVVFTPRLDQAGVDGIMRQYCISHLTQSSYFRIMEINARVESVRHADEVVICNALMTVIPVRMFAEIHYHSRELFEYLAQLCERMSIS